MSNAETFGRKVNRRVRTRQNNETEGATCRGRFNHRVPHRTEYSLSKAQPSTMYDTAVATECVCTDTHFKCNV